MADKNPYDAPQRHPHELEGSSAPWAIGCAIVAVIVLVLAILAFGSFFLLRATPMPAQPVPARQVSPVSSEEVEVIEEDKRAADESGENAELQENSR